MTARRWLMTLAMSIGLLTEVACARVGQREAGVAVPPATQTTLSTVGIREDVGVVDVTPIPETAISAQPTGESEPGAAPSDGATAEPDQQTAQPQSATTKVYVDSTSTFRVSYPETFVVQPLPADRLALLEPAPAAALAFLSPIAASSDAPELEPADLEIRTYVVGDQASLETWLTANGLLPADGSPAKAFTGAHVSGIEVCASTMIAPGCSYFVLGKEQIYHMIPSSLDGEAIRDSFAFAP